MARRSLKPHLNQIRTWVRQGRTDAWIAHQLEVTVQQIDAFKRENDLAPAEENGAEAVAADFDDEIDLRAEDDALIAAELEEAEARRAEEEAAKAAAAEEEAAKAAAEKAAKGEDDDEDEDSENGDAAAKRRRGRRGGRGRARRAPSPTTFEGTFDHGEEGYGLWLDPAVSDSPIYAEHWAGHRPVEVTVEEDQIVIWRATTDDDQVD
jgi:hypothetical protein